MTERLIRRTDIGLDDEVYAVVYTDSQGREFWMQETYTSDAQARGHWRFHMPWTAPEDSRVERVPYRTLIEKAYMRTANPFEAVANLQFIEEMGEANA